MNQTSMWDGKGYAITFALLLCSMVALFVVPSYRLIEARSSYAARHDAAEEEVLPKMTLDEFSAAVDQFREDGKNIADGDFRSYFAFIYRSSVLERVGARLDGAGNGEARFKLMPIRPITMGVSNTFMSAMRADASGLNIEQSAEFKAAQEACDLEKEIAARMEAAPEGFTFAAVAGLIGQALLFCLPFSFGLIGLMLRRREGHPFGMIIAAYFSDWRLPVSACAGPAAPIVFGMLMMDREKVHISMKHLSFALSTVLSVFFTGGLAGVAKAQSSSGGKKASGFLIQREEADESGVSSTSMAGLTYLPTHSSFEGIFVKGKGFMRTYELFVQRVASVKRPRFSSTLSTVTGLMTFKSGSGGTTVYAVTGARASIASGRFFWNTPHAALETPLSRNARLTSVVVTRPGFKLTDKVSIVNEWFGRFTRGAKPKLTSYLLVNVKLGSRWTGEFGPYRTNGGFTGFRFQLGFAR